MPSATARRTPRTPTSCSARSSASRPGADGGYTVPADNPFVGGPGADEVFAYGFRNPFRFSIDVRSGSIAIGDVGQSAMEEVDIVPLAEAKGANFGWDALEGTHRADPLADCKYEDAQTPLPAESIAPTYEYPHTNSRCSVTGGLISRSRRLPSLRDKYVFADLCHRGLFTFDPPADGETVPEVDRIKLPSAARHVDRTGPPGPPGPDDDRRQGAAADEAEAASASRSAGASAPFGEAHARGSGLQREGVNRPLGRREAARARSRQGRAEGPLRSSAAPSEEADVERSTSLPPENPLPAGTLRATLERGRANLNRLLK